MAFRHSFKLVKLSWYSWYLLAVIADFENKIHNNKCKTQSRLTRNSNFRPFSQHNYLRIVISFLYFKIKIKKLKYPFFLSKLSDGVRRAPRLDLLMLCVTGDWCRRWQIFIFQRRLYFFKKILNPRFIAQLFSVCVVDVQKNVFLLSV